jgi:hypothetical protein
MFPRVLRRAYCISKNLVCQTQRCAKTLVVTSLPQAVVGCCVYLADTGRYNHHEETGVAVIVGVAPDRLRR